jgi:serine-type D-Ala-D-Ala carboxypeptidase/endopeptidase (penicillin-binding protein 4)
MGRRLRGTAAEGWARLKTGTLRNVTALAGFVRDTRGDTWAVVAMVNHEQAAKARPALDALVEWVATSGARWR